MKQLFYIKEIDLYFTHNEILCSKKFLKDTYLIDKDELCNCLIKDKTRVNLEWFIQEDDKLYITDRGIKNIEILKKNNKK